MAAASQAEDAAQALAGARKLYGEEGPRLALPEFERALALFQKAGDRKGEAVTLGLIGNCYKKFGDFPRALELLQQALGIKREIGDRLEEATTLSHLGLLHWEMGKYPEAIDYLEHSIALARELGDPKVEGAGSNNLGLVYDELGDYRKSIPQYERALELYRGADFDRGRSDTLGNIGGVHYLLGHYRQAMEYYRQSLAISERLNLKPSMSLDLGNLALCHLGLGQIPEAIEAFDRALAIAKEAGVQRDEADWRKGKGTALVRIGQYAKALDEYRSALDLYEQAGWKREMVEGLHERGALHLLLGDPGSAERDFRRALELAREINHPRGVTSNLIALGNLEGRRGRDELAVALYRDALARATEADDQNHSVVAGIQLALMLSRQGGAEEANRASQQALDTARSTGSRALEAQAVYAQGETVRGAGKPVEALPYYSEAERLARDLGDPDLEWRVFYGRGQALEALGRDGEAITDYRRAVEVIEQVRGQLREERFRAGYVEDKYQVYIALIRLLLRTGQIGEAFRFSEKLRARAYLEMISRGPAPIRDPAQSRTEAELRARVEKLAASYAQELDKPASETRSQAVEVFSSELAQAERDYQDFLDTLVGSDAAYAAVRTLAVPPAEEVQRRLPPRAALLEYVVGEEEITVFVVTPESLRATTVPVQRRDLVSRVELLNDLLQRPASPDWVRPAAGLRRLLVDPLISAGFLEGVERLYVVPHGVLHYVPFAALPQEGNGPARYLVDEWAITYLPAAAVLIHSAASISNGKNLFALAPSRAKLRFSEQEVRAVARLYGAASTALVRRQATESAFKQRVGNHSVIHLATHGYFNRPNPLFSGVELEPDGANDGRLEVHEILDLQLEAKLVTLSACDTALGGGYFTDIPAGDDLVGLTRAFLFAGSDSVLASLWQVNDRSTLELMNGFYSELRESDKADALARAQRAMARPDSRYRHPYYWAAFVLVGQMD
jgi:CHAT domain-containing protein/Tfp pilus assembly protein PilF